MMDLFSMEIPINAQLVFLQVKILMDVAELVMPLTVINALKEILIPAKSVVLLVYY